MDGLLRPYPKSSKQIFKNIFKTNLNLAVDLFAMVKSSSADDPTHRFQIAGIIIFMAGIDKVLTIACEMACLLKIIDWDWLSRGKKINPVGGIIECNQGLERKLNKFIELGLNFEPLHELREERNSYIHEVSTKVGYIISPTPGGAIIKPDFALHPPISSIQTSIDSNEIKAKGNYFINELGTFIDNYPWKTMLINISKKVQELPINPIGYQKILDSNDMNERHILLEELNKRYIGNHLEKLYPLL